MENRRAKEMNKVKLGDIAKYSDTRVRLSYLTVENYIGTDNMLQNKQGKVNSDYLLKKGQTTQYTKNDILIANIRPYLKKIWYATNEGGSSADVLTIRLKDNNFLPKFVYYNLFQDSFFDYAMKVSKGSKMPRGDKNQILNFLISNFDLPTQSAIADVLSSLDDKIALNNRINKELEDLAKTIYEYWFVQNADEKWEKRRLEEIAIIVNGATPSTNDISNYGDEIIWITPKDISDQKSKFTYYGERNITEKGYQSCNTKLIPEYSILLSSRAPIGLLSMATTQLCTNQGIKSIIPNDSIMCWYLYYYILKHIKPIQQLGAGTTFMEVSKSNLCSFLVTCPTLEILEKWQFSTTPLFKNQLSIAKENLHLVQLRDWLLPMLMNGQVSVKESSI